MPFRRTARGDSATAHEARQQDAVSGYSVDPVVQINTLTSLLTGDAYDVVTDDPRWGHVVAGSSNDRELIIPLTRKTELALAQSTDEGLMAAAPLWAETDEFGGATPPEELLAFLRRLRDVARHALAASQHLYCHVLVK